MPIYIVDIKNQIFKIKKIIESDLRSFYYDSDKTIEERMNNLRTSNMHDDEMQELREDVRKLKNDSAPSVLDTALLLGSINRPSTTVVVNNNNATKTVPKKEEKEEKKETTAIYYYYTSSCYWWYVHRSE